MHTLNLSALATYVNNPEISAVPARRHAPCREGLVLAAMLLSGAGTTLAAQTIRYPPARKGDVVDDYHGTKVPDPYRWLEDVDAPETRAWIEAENRVTGACLAEIRERDVESGRDRPDHLKWVKFSDASWTHDGAGFFYSRYPEPAGENPLLAENRFQKLYYHRLGTDQAQDVLVYERPDHPDWGVAAAVTHDGRYAIFTIWLGTDRRNRVYYLDLRDARRPRVTGDVVRLLDDFDASYGFIGNEGPLFYFVTDLDAPRKRVIAIDTRHPERARWREIIPQGEDVIELVSIIHDSFVASYLHDAHSRVRVLGLDGRFVKDVELPTLGSITQITGERQDDEMFFGFTSFLYPTTIFRYDFATGDTSVFKAPSIDFDPTQYETRQVFYTSKDGTRVPMFITHRKGLKLDGSNPTYLRGYGGFNVGETPAFAVTVVVWLEMRGVSAAPHLRGGGRYGE